MTLAYGLAGALGSIPLSACHRGPDAAQVAALHAGREAIAGCQERFHEQSRTYADCVRYVAQTGKVEEDDRRLAEWRALGALYSGWVTADHVGQQGDEDAEDAARTLVREAAAMQARTGVRDASLCELLSLPCATVANRRNDLLQPSTRPGVARS